MNKIIMQLPAASSFSYPIFIDSGLLSHPAKWLPRYADKKKIVIITDDNVKKYYGLNLAKTLRDDGYQPLLISFLPGEKSKNYYTKQHLEEKILEYHGDRETIILALGGGVVGDIAGFIAATYMRGVPYIQIPTTLLAMVDSSVGGKTGIDMPQGKNLIGAFWQPYTVVADLNCLKTLSQEHLINGLIEALKMFITNSRDDFNFTEGCVEEILTNNKVSLHTIIQRAIEIKTEIVSRDERESNLRMILNFGHTIGHALEKITHYTLLHGYAVALGILVEAKISQLLGILSQDDFQKIQALFYKLNICGSQIKQMNFDQIINSTKLDKKIKDGHPRYILLKTIGAIYKDHNNIVHPVPDKIVKHALNEVSEVRYGG